MPAARCSEKNASNTSRSITCRLPSLYVGHANRFSKIAFLMAPAVMPKRGAASRTSTHACSITTALILVDLDFLVVIGIDRYGSRIGDGVTPSPPVPALNHHAHANGQGEFTHALRVPNER